MTLPNWKDLLTDRVAPALAEEIDIFETQIELRKKGKIDEKVFAETRLRRGAYGQRYDNGQRHDGIDTRKLAYPERQLTKGPDDLWDAPGMQRIKIPFGGVTAEQLEVLADSPRSTPTRSATSPRARTSSSTSSTSRTRPTSCAGSRPSASRRARRAATRSATSPPARSPACAGTRRSTSRRTPKRARCTSCSATRTRRTSAASSRSRSPAARDDACGLAHMHDIGLIAATRDGRRTASSAASSCTSAAASARCRSRPSCSTSSCPRRSCCRCRRRSAACSRGSARSGTARARASSSWSRSSGIDEFKRLVVEERAKLPPTIRAGRATSSRAATDRRASRRVRRRRPLRRWSNAARDGFAGVALAPTSTGAAPARLRRSAVMCLPLGDITSRPVRALADIARKYNGGRLRTTVEQNIVFRWVREARPAGALRRPHGGRARASRAPAHRRRHRVPGHRHLQAGHLVVARARRRAAQRRIRRRNSSSTRRRTCTSRSAAASTRAASTTSRTSASTASAATSATARCRTSRWCSAASGRTTRRPTGWPSARCRRSAIPEVVDRLTGLYRARAPAGRELPGLHHAHRQGARPRDARGLTGAGLRGGSELLLRLGRPARVHDRRHGRGRVRGRGGAVRRVRAGGERAHGVRGAVDARRGQGGHRGGEGAPRHAPGGQGGDADPEHRSATTRRDRRASSSSHFYDTSSSAIRTPAASSRSTSSTRTSSRRASHDEAAHQRIEEAQLFIEAAHALYNRTTAS